MIIMKSRSDLIIKRDDRIKLIALKLTWLRAHLSDASTLFLVPILFSVRKAVIIEEERVR